MDDEDKLRESRRSIFSQIRLLQILTALGRAGISPASVDEIHAFAFFANVLSPLWDLEPLEGAVLKTREGPYYPGLQAELDVLVGRGFVRVDRFSYRTTDLGVVRLDATFQLVPVAARTVLDTVSMLPDEVDGDRFLTELAFAFADINPNRRDDAPIFDAAFSDPAVAENRVIDFAQWKNPEQSDASVRVARGFQKYAPAGMTLNRAEQLVLYMRLMKRRAHG